MAIERVDVDARVEQRLDAREVTGVRSICPFASHAAVNGPQLGGFGPPRGTRDQGYQRAGRGPPELKVRRRASCQTNPNTLRRFRRSPHNNLPSPPPPPPAPPSS